MSKVARIRIQIDLELDCPLDGYGFDPNEPDFEERVRFFYEENHCVENETARALELINADRERKEAAERTMNSNVGGGLCVTCHGASMTLLGIKDAP